MPVYTVHEPPRRSEDELAHTSRFVFVRDGFHFWAFLLTPLWLLLCRLWVEFIVYALLIGGATFLLHRIGADEPIVWVWLLLSLLIGMEASTLRRWKLARRGFANVGIVVGDDLEDAERRFFDGWAPADRPVIAPSPPPPSPFDRPPAESSDIVGLFPQPEGRP